MLELGVRVETQQYNSCMFKEYPYTYYLRNSHVHFCSKSFLTLTLIYQPVYRKQPDWMLKHYLNVSVPTPRSGKKG